MSPIDPTLWLAIPKPPSGYTWTLASRLGDMLNMAEELFGKRDPSYTILGVEFTLDNPRVWYPGDRRHVVVQLGISAASDVPRACWQLAHETVHLLAPNGGNDGVNLEEGVACYFADHYLKKAYPASKFSPDVPSYIRALNLVMSTLDKDIQCIGRLRKVEPSFSRFSKDAVVAEFPDLSPKDIDFLLAKFDRDAPPPKPSPAPAS